MAGKKRHMTHYIGCRICVTCCDGRTIVGKLMAFDKHSNMILADSERFTTLRSGKSERCSVGLILIRGGTVISVSHRNSISTNADVPDDRRKTSSGV